jgi:ammonium transporter, Amt family
MGNIADLTLLISGALLMMGTAGFAMINTGLSRAHASATLCLTSIGIFAMAVLSYHFIGFGLMYDTANDEFFPLSLATFTSSIILGALTERIKVWPVLIFTALFSGIIFPFIGGWSWGGGWLRAMEFHDFAGSSVIHITAGCAALAGVHILGPRTGRYAPDGRPIPFSASNVPLAALGAFLASLGFMGLTTGQGLYDTSPAFSNMLLGGAGGVLGALLYVTWRYAKPDTTIIINAFLAGLVSVSAGADIFWPAYAVVVGGVGGILCVIIIPLLDKYKFDDPAGVTPVHLAGGIWGILAVVFTGHIVGQITGLVATLVFATGASIGAWLLVKRLTGLRCSLRAERHGLDMEAVGLEAYADFPIRTAGRPDITQIDRY